MCGKQMPATAPNTFCTQEAVGLPKTEISKGVRDYLSRMASMTRGEVDAWPMRLQMNPYDNGHNFSY